MSLTQVFTIDQGTFKQALDFNIRSRGNLIALGMAGTGKTEMAIQACDRAVQARMIRGHIYLNLSVLEAPDLVGLPTIENGRVKYAAPQFMPQMEKQDDGTYGLPYVLVVDEIDKAKPELQNPLLELLQSHSINGTKLHIQSIIATGNLPDEGAFSQPISHALTNRCQVFQLTHNFDAWADWAQEAEVNPLVIGFLSKNREYLSMPAVEGDPTAYCRASPRSWTLAARDVDQTSSSDSVDFQTLLVAGRVGTAAATKFRVWLDHYRHVEPIVEALVKNGTHPATGLTVDKLLVTAISAVNAVAQEGRAVLTATPKDKDKVIQKTKDVAKRVFGWVQTLPTEFQIGAVKTTLNMQLIQGNELTKVPEVMNTYLSVRKALKGSP